MASDINDGKVIDLNNGAPTWREKQERVRKHIDTVSGEVPPPRLYRSDLLMRIKNQRYGDTTSASRLGLKEIAQDCDMAVNTVRAILEGTGSKIENIYRVARYFGVPWAALFDMDRDFCLNQRDDGTGFDIVGMTDLEKTVKRYLPATPKTASRSKGPRK